MPLEIILVLLPLMAIAAIALRASRRRRRDPGRHVMAGERPLAWLGDRIDESIGMWALRRLLGRADDDDHEALDEQLAGPSAATSSESAPADRLARLFGETPPADLPTLRERAYGRMPVSASRSGRGLSWDAAVRDQRPPDQQLRDQRLRDQRPPDRASPGRPTRPAVARCHGRAVHVRCRRRGRRQPAAGGPLWRGRGSDGDPGRLASAGGGH